jgi:uncharacterized protein (TIGR03435 family)
MRAVSFWLLLLSSGCAVAQTADSSVRFEAVTIKPPDAVRYLHGRLGNWGWENERCTGGPGTPDPRLLRCDVTPAELLVNAYQLTPVQFAAPESMESTLLHIEAKVPAGATPEQVRLMEQDLLAERFKLAVHFVRMDVAAYEMAVAKHGPKFTASKKLPKPGQAWGAPVGSIGQGRVHLEMPRSMDQLVRFLSAFTDLPVFDGTGLTGSYDIDLMFGDSTAWVVSRELPRGPFSDSLPEGPPLAEALRDQLGLILERTTIPADVLIVDHVEPKPTPR